KITCPVLIHFHERDGILDGLGADAALFCSAFDENKTVICVTHDGNHTMPSNLFSSIFSQFLRGVKIQTSLTQNDSWIKWASNIIAVSGKDSRTVYTPAQFKAQYGSIFDR